VTVVLVALGGALGAAARFLTSELARRVAPWAWRGTATLAVNILGSFALGLLTGGAAGMDAAWRTALAAGLLGGFTTFSAASVECAAPLQAPAPTGRAKARSAMAALGGAALMLAASAGAAWLGLTLTS
jgi:CrcB protein